MFAGILPPAAAASLNASPPPPRKQTPARSASPTRTALVEEGKKNFNILVHRTLQRHYAPLLGKTEPPRDPNLKLVIPKAPERKLNSEQKSAVEADLDRPLLIKAGAGTGKTSVLEARIESMILHKKVPARNILAVTYTNAGCEELRERLSAKLKSDDKVLVSTIHGFAFLVVRAFWGLLTTEGCEWVMEEQGDGGGVAGPGAPPGATITNGTPAGGGAASSSKASKGGTTSRSKKSLGMNHDAPDDPEPFFSRQPIIHSSVPLRKSIFKEGAYEWHWQRFLDECAGYLEIDGGESWPRVLDAFRYKHSAEFQKSLQDAIDDAVGKPNKKHQVLRYRSTFLHFDGRPLNSGWVGQPHAQSNLTDVPQVVYPD